MNPSRGAVEIQHDEAVFHDKWAASTPLEQIAVRQAFEAPTAMENRYILRLLGDLRGKKLLDIGAGLGESSVYFALKGADVTCTDLSPKMVETAVKLADHHGVKLQGIVSAAESLNVPDNHFDVVYIANTIHHVTDKDRLLEQTRRALKSGGTFVSIDPLAYNPAINAYRKKATEVRTEDEAPLTFSELDRVRKYFVNVRHREFWIATLALFLKYYLIDRVHPNQDRYWKRIFKETPGKLWWWMPLRWTDALLTRLPLLRRLAWNIVISGKKA